MKPEKHLAFWIAPFFALLCCSPALAGTKRKLFKALVKSGGGAGGSGGGASALPLESLFTGLSVSALAFGLACAAIFFLHTWFISSLAAAKILALLGVFSFLAWPLFIAALLPSAIAFSFGATLCHDMASGDPYGALFLAALLMLAGVLYFYLIIIILTALSSAPWGKRLTRTIIILALAGGIAGAIIQGGMTPLFLFLLCAFCAWAAWKTHGKITARAEAKKHRPAP